MLVDIATLPTCYVKALVVVTCEGTGERTRRMRRNGRLMRRVHPIKIHISAGRPVAVYQAS